MPFLTEEIWQYIKKRTPEEALIISKWPEAKLVNASLVSQFEFAQEVVSGIRTIRKNKNISFKETINLSVVNSEKVATTFDSVIVKLGNVESLSYVETSIDGALTFRVKSNEYFIPVAGAINVEEEIKKLTEELSYTEGFLKSVQKKLSNERFMAGAPEQVIANERKKEADALAKIETLKSGLASLQ